MAFSPLKFVGFPGMGIELFELDPVAFSVFGFDIVWYGIIITCGIILSVLYAMMRSKSEEGVSIDNILDIALISIPAGIVGARLYFVLFKLDSFHSFYDVVNIRNGGLAIYGGIIFGFLTAFIITKIKKISTVKVFDICAPAFFVGQLIGRWGNFMNVEAYGSKTDLPWRMAISDTGAFISEVHPTFLYESMWNILGFVLINLLYKKKRFDGQIFLMYITWYGFGRMFIEGLRTDSLYLGQFRVSQLIGAACFLGGVVLIVVNMMKSKSKVLESEEYESVFKITQLESEIEDEQLNSGIILDDPAGVYNTGESASEDDFYESAQTTTEDDGGSEDGSDN